MSPELTDRLFRKYPLLYNVQGFRFECDDGWYTLINELSKKLERALEAMAADMREYYRAAQVKEKFGGLRFYLMAATAEMAEWIDEAEEQSFAICETCGAPGKLTGKSWLKTACEEHAK